MGIAKAAVEAVPPKQFVGIGMDVAKTPTDEFKAELEKNDQLKSIITVHHMEKTDGSPIATVCDDGSLDVVTAFFVIHHIDQGDARKATVELVRGWTFDGVV